MADEMLKIKQKFQHHEKDTGSIETQIVDITEKINDLAGHFKLNPKDFSSRRGLIKLVNRRRKFLDYVKKGNENLYKQLVDNLNLRK